MKIEWSPLSLQQVQEIADYISLDSMAAADNWIGSIFDEVDLLKTNTEIGRIVPEIERHDIRELLHGNYRIIYTGNSKKIAILTVRHFKQILPVSEITDNRPFQ